MAVKPVGMETGTAALATTEAMIETMKTQNSHVEMAASMEDVVFFMAVENSKLRESQKAKYSRVNRAKKAILVRSAPLGPKPSRGMDTPTMMPTVLAVINAKDATPARNFPFKMESLKIG